MCEQETIFNLMRKNCTPEEDKSLGFAFKEAAIKDYKSLKKDVVDMKSDVADIKHWVEKQNGMWAGFKWFVNSKLGAVIVLAILTKFIGVEVYQAIAQPMDMTSILTQGDK